MYGHEHLDTMFHEMFLNDLKSFHENGSPQPQPDTPPTATKIPSAGAKAPTTPVKSSELPVIAAAGVVTPPRVPGPPPGNLIPTSSPTTAEDLEAINCYFILNDSALSSPAQLRAPPKPSPFRKYTWVDCFFYGFWLDETLAEAYLSAATAASPRADGAVPKFADRPYWSEALVSAQGVLA